MATYRVVLKGVLKGLEADQVAPQLAMICKIPVEGAKVLLASPSMVIRRGLNAEMAAEYKSALRSIGCTAVIEQDTGSDKTAVPLASRSSGAHGRFALDPQVVRQRLGALTGQLRNIIVAMAGFAQQYGNRAREQLNSGKAPAGGSKFPLTGVTPSKATGARGFPAIRWVKRSFRPTTLIIGGVGIATAAIAGYLVIAGPEPGGPCPRDYDTTRWTDCVGEMRFPNGEKYVGDFKDGQPHGQGTLTWSNGERYVGTWSNGKRNGRGAFSWPDGSIYVGEFRNDKKHGHGTMTFANGRKYVGEFKDGNPVGEQRFTSAAPKK